MAFVNKTDIGKYALFCTICYNNVDICIIIKKIFFVLNRYYTVIHHTSITIIIR